MGEKELLKTILDESQFSVDLEIASFVLKSGGTLVYPTETVWGIGCDATDYDAVEQVFQLKGTNDGKALIILVNSLEMIKDYVETIPEIALNILKESTNPTTIIYPKAKNLASNIIAEDGSVGIRITSDPFCRELIKKIHLPLVSTSANFTGAPTPRGFSEIDIDLIYNTDYVVRWSQETKSTAKPSSIIKILNNGETMKIR